MFFPNKTNINTHHCFGCSSEVQNCLVWLFDVGYSHCQLIEGHHCLGCSSEVQNCFEWLFDVGYSHCWPIEGHHCLGCSSEVQNCLGWLFDVGYSHCWPLSWMFIRSPELFGMTVWCGLPCLTTDWGVLLLLATNFTMELLRSYSFC